MLEQFVPRFDDAVFEGYNAKLPDEENAYKEMDGRLNKMGFKRRSMPTARPTERRFMYWKGQKNVIVTVYYAGGYIYVEIPAKRTEARLAQNTVGSFISDHVEPYDAGN